MDGRSRWVSVYAGPVWKAMAVQSMLDEAGILTQVPDSNTRTIDPFITGGDAFSLAVLVPEDAAQAARAIVADHERVSEPRVVAPGDPTVHRIAHNMRWLTTLVVTTPIAFVLGLVYLSRVRRAGIRPADHGFNVFTFAVAGLLSLAAVASLVGIQLSRR